MADPTPLDDIAAAAGAPQDAPDLRVGEAPDGGEAYDVAELGDHCPVSPLGFLGKSNYFLDFAGQLIELGTEFRKGECMQLFGTKMRWLEHKWPTKKEVTDKRTGEKDWIITGFDQKEAQKGLIMACAKQGLFDPTGKVRGRGAHRGDGGELFLHCGDQVLIGGQRGTRQNVKKPTWAKAGLLGGYVYPTATALSRPDEAAAPDTIGKQVLKLLDSWNWKRKNIDAYLFFCWLAAAPFGGAYKWRPHAWLTGPSGAGKTTLQRFAQDLLAGWGIHTEDATEAGVRQLLNQDTLAVMFDEIEPDEHNADVHMKIVKLARLASSGGSSLRGGQDHKSRQFVARSCFLFSSIHHHDLPAQDRNRITVLHLSKFPPKSVTPIMPAMLGQWGAQLRRRTIEQWHRFDETLLAYQREMLKQGYSGREQDQYGTLLAAGDLLLHNDVPDTLSLGDEADRCERLVGQLAHVLDSARAEAEDTTERCLKALASHRLPARGNEQQENVGSWLRRALIAIIVPEGSSAPKEKLLNHGMRLVNLSADHAKGQGGLLDAYLHNQTIYLAVANKTNKGMAEIFEGSTFRGGVWTQSLALVEGAITNKKSRFGGPPEGCVLVPLEELIDVAQAKIDANILIETTRTNS